MKKFLDFYYAQKRVGKELSMMQQKTQKSNVMLLTKEDDFNFDSWKDILLVDQDYIIELSEMVQQQNTKDSVYTAIINLNSSVDVDVFVVENNKTIMKIDNHSTVNVPVNTNDNVELIVNPKIESAQIGDINLDVEMLNKKLNYKFTAYRFYIDADFNRNGKIEENNTYIRKWKWGYDGEGPVLLNSVFKSDVPKTDFPVEYLSEVNIRKFGPENYPDDFKLILELNEGDANRIRLYLQDDIQTENSGSILGEGTRWTTLENNMFKNNILKLYAQALEYPDRNFDGIVNLRLNFAVEVKADDKKMLIPLYTDESLNPSMVNIQFFVAPWIATPNTQEARKLFVSQLPDNSNIEFVKKAEEIAGIAGVEFEAVPGYLNRNDPWMQDENQMGYSEAANTNLDVVLESPRNRGLDMFPHYGLYGPHFGYVSRSGSSPKCSLDSFGNLDVTPPFTSNGIEYPLGRIIYGGKLPGTAGRRMQRIMRDFLAGQQVQKPLELYTDWLNVGHVDEMLSFVPDKSKDFNMYSTSKGFKLLLGSPKVFYQELCRLEQYGHGDAVIMKDKFWSDGRPMQTTVSDMVNNYSLREINEEFQEKIDYNRELLKKELGLRERYDIIDIPAVFTLEKGRALALIPGMVNMIVLNEHLIIPKPFGPVINGECQIEKYVREQLEPLGLVCHFVDDWSSYHIQEGEVHCGSKVLRKPFDFKWWNSKPELDFDN